MNAILEAKNLTKIFKTEGKPSFTAVDHVSFSLKAGETLGIVGESGCGKSTLVKMLMRLMPSTEGTISLQGKDITRCRGKALRESYREIQMVFQSPIGSFDPRKTLGYGIEESLKNTGVSKEKRRERAIELLAACGLPAEFADRYPHEVSGGQCQRAAIARALAISPSVLICDEATSALDVTVQKQVMELLEELRREQKLSIIFICHNLALVQSFCDRVLVMYGGRIVEQGTPDEVILSPKSDYTKTLVDAAIF